VTGLPLLLVLVWSNGDRASIIIMVVLLVVMLQGGR
jgi:hypothetical protein